jgi:hypothetical protein
LRPDTVAAYVRASNAADLGGLLDAFVDDVNDQLCDSPPAQFPCQRSALPHNPTKQGERSRLE